MGTTAGWLATELVPGTLPEEPGSVSWKAMEVPADVRAVGEAVADSAREESGRGLGIVAFDSSFGFLSLLESHLTMRIVLRPAAASGSVEGVEALAITEGGWAADEGFSWQVAASRRVLDVKAVATLAESAMSDRPFEPGVGELLHGLGVDVELTLEGVPVILPRTREAMPAGERYALRFGEELLFVDVVDLETGESVGTFDSVGLAMAESARLNGHTYRGTRHHGPRRSDRRDGP
jgi:hypothetical protein